jgi:hypothetical protein
LKDPPDSTLEEILNSIEANFTENKIKKVDFNHFQQYKKYLKEKHGDQSDPIKQFIDALCYLPMEHKDAFDKIREMNFDSESFQLRNQLSLYSFDLRGK